MKRAELGKAIGLAALSLVLMAGAGGLFIATVSVGCPVLAVVGIFAIVGGVSLRNRIGQLKISRLQEALIKLIWALLVLGELAGTSYLVYLWIVFRSAAR